MIQLGCAHTSSFICLSLNQTRNRMKRKNQEHRLWHSSAVSQSCAFVYLRTWMVADISGLFQSWEAVLFALPSYFTVYSVSVQIGGNWGNIVFTLSFMVNKPSQAACNCWVCACVGHMCHPYRPMSRPIGLICHPPVTQRAHTLMVREVDSVSVPSLASCISSISSSAVLWLSLGSGASEGGSWIMLFL